MYSVQIGPRLKRFRPFSAKCAFESRRVVSDSSEQVARFFELFCLELLTYGFAVGKVVNIPLRPCAQAGFLNFWAFASEREKRAFPSPLGSHVPLISPQG